jgi:hypothetical protein
MSRQELILALFPGTSLYLADIPPAVIFTASDWFNVMGGGFFNDF